MFLQLHKASLQPTDSVSRVSGLVHGGQEHHDYLSNTVVCGQELHGSFSVAVVDVVKLGQEPHDSLADPVGVEPHGAMVTYLMKLMEPK